MAASLQLLTELGVEQGVCRDRPQHLLPDNMAWYIHDAILDTPGAVRRRGPVVKLSGTSNFSSNQEVQGLGAMLNPAGVLRYIVLMNDASTWKLSLRDATNAAGASFTVTASFTGTAAFDFKPAQNNLSVIGVGQYYGSSAAHALRWTYLWRGAIKANYTTGTIAVTQNSPIVTGSGTSWTANAEPGMFLCLTSATGQYLGTIKSVDSNTQITLEQNVLMATSSGLAYGLTSLRGMSSTVAACSGRITTATGSTTVNGGNTKFVDENVGGGLVFAIVKNQPTYIGTVNAVNSNSQLVLNANATTSTADASYFITQPVGTNPNQCPVGFISAFWNGMQFTANKDVVSASGPQVDTIWISHPQLIDAVDVTSDGDNLTLPAVKLASGITGMIPTETGLLVFRPDETYLIQGTSPDNLKANKILDDGCYSGTALVGYKTGAIWPGRKGVYRFDGSTVANILEGRASANWMSYIGTQDNELYRFYAMEERDHYILKVIYEGTPPIYSNSGNDYASSDQCWLFNLRTGAVSFLSNIALRGAVKVPNIGTVWAFMSNDYALQAHSFLARASDLFADSFSNETVGLGWSGIGVNYQPFLSVESKLYDAGSPQLLKQWKQFQLWSDRGQDVGLDVMVGLGKQYVATNTSITASAWKNTKTLFQGRSTHVAIRLKQVTSLGGLYHIGPWAFAYKPMRVGRV